LTGRFAGWVVAKSVDVAHSEMGRRGWICLCQAATGAVGAVRGGMIRPWSGLALKRAGLRPATTRRNGGRWPSCPAARKRQVHQLSRTHVCSCSGEGRYYRLFSTAPRRPTRRDNTKKKEQNPVELSEVEFLAAPRVNRWRIRRALESMRRNGSPVEEVKPGEAIDPQKVIDLAGRSAGWNAGLGSAGGEVDCDAAWATH